MMLMVFLSMEGPSWKMVSSVIGSTARVTNTGVTFSLVCGGDCLHLLKAGMPWKFMGFNSGDISMHNYHNL